MTGIIVDDETRAVNMLKTLCEEYCTGIDILGSAGSVDEGLDLIASVNPQLVFLDIQMPVKNGFQLLDQYGEELPFAVIFTTAHDQYALEAFKYAAVDYLLKPIEIDALTKAIERANKHYNKVIKPCKKSALKKSIEQSSIEKIALTTIDGFNFVNYKDIVRCEAQGNYTEVMLIDGSSLLITKTLKHYEDILIHKDFFRVHKSHLVNLNFIRRFVKGRQGMIEMTDGQLIEVSLRKKEALLEKMASR